MVKPIHYFEVNLLLIIVLIINDKGLHCSKRIKASKIVGPVTPEA